MQKPRAPRLPNAPILRWLAGGLAALYLACSTPLVPVLTAFLARLDRSHHAAIQSVAGGVRIVLRHDGNCAGALTHRHGVVARALTLFAERSSAAQPDHVLQFSTGSTAVASPVQASAEAAPEGAPVSNDLLSDAIGLTALVSVQPRPPPEANEMFAGLRSIVLRL